MAEFGSSSDKENRTVNGEGKSTLVKKWQPLEEDNMMTQASGDEGNAQAEQTEEENDKTTVVVNQRSVICHFWTEKWKFPWRISYRFIYSSSIILMKLKKGLKVELFSICLQ